MLYKNNIENWLLSEIHKFLFNHTHAQNVMKSVLLKNETRFYRLNNLRVFSLLNFMPRHRKALRELMQY